MYRHFSQLTLHLKDLKAKYAGQTGVWLAYSFPSMDEVARQNELGYYEGQFEYVLQQVIKDHGRNYIDGALGCGEIVPIVPKKVVANDYTDRLPGEVVPIKKALVPT